MKVCCDTEGRELTDERRYAPTSVPLRRKPCSRSPETLFHFTGISTRKKPSGWEENLPPNLRHAECAVRRSPESGTPQEVWKLSGAGSVGGQALLGIAALEGLRRRAGAEVWPFQTLGEGRAHVLAEMYPSLIEPEPGSEVKDARQVRTWASAFQRVDSEGDLARHLWAAGEMPAAVREEEAAILGMDDPATFQRVLQSRSLRESV